MIILIDTSDTVVIAGKRYARYEIQRTVQPAKPSRIMAHHRELWTEAEDQTILEMKKKEITSKVIARSLGRTAQAVDARYAVLRKTPALDKQP